MDKGRVDTMIAYCKNKSSTGFVFVDQLTREEKITVREVCEKQGYSMIRPLYYDYVKQEFF